MPFKQDSKVTPVMHQQEVIQAGKARLAQR